MMPLNLKTSKKALFFHESVRIWIDLIIELFDFH